MSDDSLPYLSDIQVTKLVVNADLTADFTVSWNTASTKPDLVQIYTQFGSDSQISDLGNLRASVYPDQSPFRVPVSGSDNDTYLFIAVAPRKVNPADGSCTDTMEDSSGEMQAWETFMAESGFPLHFSPNAPGGQLPPPNIQVSSSVKTLTSNDQMNFTVYSVGPGPFDSGTSQTSVIWRPRPLPPKLPGRVHSRSRVPVRVASAGRSNCSVCGLDVRCKAG